MKNLVKGLALLIAVTCLVWVAVLWRWQSTSRDMSVGDIVWYLGVLPLVVVGLILMVRWAWRGVVAKQAAQAAATAGSAATSGGAGAAGQGGAVDPDKTAGDAAERHIAHAVWLASACTAAGPSVDELLSAAKDHAPRPQPDAELVDDDGLPVMCARMPDLPLDEVGVALAEVAEAVRAGLPPEAPQPPELDGSVRRALAALAPALQEALDALRPWQAVFEKDEAARLQVLLGLPAGWTAFEREVAKRWVHRVLAAPDATVVPAQHMSLQGHAEGGEALWAQADQALLLMARQQSRGLMLVLAVHSDLSERGLAQLAQAGRLFHAQQRPQGHMPGEAAAALLLASQDWPLLPPDGDDPDLAPLAWVHRPAVARRGKPIDAAGKVDAGILTATVQAAQAAGRIDMAELAALVCDGDQHTQRGTELFSVTLELLPTLDPSDDMRLTGTVCAGAGAATPLIVIAGACAQAKVLERPVLAACLGDPLMRLALVARHDAPAADASSASQVKAMPLAA